MLTATLRPMHLDLDIGILKHIIVVYTHLKNLNRIFTNRYKRLITPYLGVA